MAGVRSEAVSWMCDPERFDRHFVMDLATQRMREQEGQMLADLVLEDPVDPACVFVAGSNVATIPEFRLSSQGAAGPGVVLPLGGDAPAVPAAAGAAGAVVPAAGAPGGGPVAGHAGGGRRVARREAHEDLGQDKGVQVGEECHYEQPPLHPPAFTRHYDSRQECKRQANDGSAGDWRKLCRCEHQPIS